MVTIPARDTAARAVRRVGRTRAGSALAARLGVTAAVARARTQNLSAADVVDLGHRLILGRSPSPDLRAAMIAELEGGLTTPGEAWASLAASPEFAGRVHHQRAVIDAGIPPHDPSLLDVEDVRTAQPIEAHNASAEAYFAGRDEHTIEQMLSKPFANAAETTELLTCFGHMVQGVQLVPGDRLLDFGAGTGWTSWMFAQLRAEVISADVSASALEYVRRRFARWPVSPGRREASYLVFDGHRLDLPDASIDKICCFDAFHHLVNQADVMAEFARVLRPGGLIGFDEPGLYHSRSAQSQYEMRTFGVVEGDIELHEMAAIARDAGLEFVAADVLTTRPIWLELEPFTDLVAHQVVDAYTAQQLANQVLTKQQFVVRKPGGTGPDSRSVHALGAEVTVRDARLEPTGTGATWHATVRLANTGTATWLPRSREVGAVALAVRSREVPGWEARLTTDRPLTLRPGETATVHATLDVPAERLGASVLLNLVSEEITWFDIVGTPAVDVQL